MALDMDKLRDKADQEQYTEPEARYLRENVGDAVALDLLRRNADAFGQPPTVDTNDKAAVDGRVAQLRQEIADREQELRGLAPVQARMAGATADEDDDEDDDPAYEAWTVQELDTEIADRNKGRSDDQKLATGGNKTDKVDRLYKDDEASA